MHRAEDINGAAAITGEVAGFEQAGAHARREEFCVPRRVIAVRDHAGIFVGENRTDALLDRLEGLVVAARRHRIAVLPVFLVDVRVPAAAAHPLDQRRADPVAFNR